MVSEPASRLRLLIACGDSDTRLHLQRVLYDAYEVHVVGDGEAALAAIRESLPDLLLAHVILPPLDGIDLLHALRADPRTRDIPAILVSDSANEDSRLDALKGRAADYLVKPFSPAELLARIDARLEIARLRRELSESDARRPPDEVAVTELARKNRRLRRERNALQRDLAKRTEEVSRLTQELIVGGETMLAIKREFNDELTPIMRLHDLSGRLLDHTAIEPLLEEVLEASIALLNADLGNVRLYDPKSQTLKIVAQRGFNQEFLNYFDNVQEGTGSSGAALERCERVIVEDVLTEPLLAEHLAIIDAAGFRAFQSTPLISRGGEMLGMISTHFRQPHRPSARELRFVDLYAAQAAEIIERKRAEEALRVSEERFRRYFELGLIGMAMTSPSKGILEVNDELCRILGYERKELLQKTWAEMTHPDDLAADVAQFNRVMAGEIDGYTLDKRWVRKDGQIIDTIMAAKCLRRPDGSVDYFVGLIQDITDRRRAEDELRNANVRIEMILDSITDKFFAFDNRWHFTYFNKNAEEQLKTLGKNPASLIGKVPWEEFQTDPAVEEAFRRAMRERAVVTHEHYYPPLGEWVENRIYPSPDGGVAVFQRYITDRKRAEEELRRSEAFLAEGQKISHTGTWAVKFPSEELLWSEEMYRIYGLDSAGTKVSQQIVFGLIHPEDRSSVQEVFDRAVRDKNDYALEHRAITADGSVKHLHVLGRPVLNQSGELIEYIGTVMDVTEPKRSEAAMQKLQTEVAHAARIAMMGELAASIAHEINQPLGALVNNGNVAMRLAEAAETTTDRLLEVLSDIVSDADRASAIIARIRSVIRKTAPEKTSLQLKELVLGILPLAQRELTAHRIEVRLEFSEDLPSVAGDRVGLQEVLLNLVMNGIDAMSDVEDHRRILTIRGEPSELNAKPAVLITVSDLGIGFKVEDRERMFEAFYSTRPNGLGMGLRISRSIVEAHGGRLSAHVNEDVGATFRFCLPAEIPGDNP